jgi:hypothetical protein
VEINWKMDENSLKGVARENVNGDEKKVLFVAFFP